MVFWILEKTMLQKLTGRWRGRTCKENIAPVQNGVLVSHFHNVQVQFLQGFFHDLGLQVGGGAKAERH